MVTALGSTILRKHLDDVPLWRGEHVAVKQLVEDFARYLYLPRLAGPEVLVQAICNGVALLTWRSDTFAYAESHDEGAARYRGLRGGQLVSLTAECAGLLVKPNLAQRQMDAEAPPPTTAAIRGSEAGVRIPAGGLSPTDPGASGARPVGSRRRCPAVPRHRAARSRARRARREPQRGWRDDGTYQKPTPEAIEARRRIAAERGAKEEAEKARERDQERIAPPAGKFRCFVVDPPWPMQKIEREERPDQGAALDYPTMDVWCTRPLACFHDAIDGYEPCPSVECVVGNVVQRSALDDSIATSTSGSPTSIFQTD